MRLGTNNKMEPCERISSYLLNTFSHERSTVKEAERMLINFQIDPLYSFYLFKIIFETSSQIEIKVAASIALKNYININWPSGEDDESIINIEMRQKIKDKIFDCCLPAPKKIQVQILSVISNIAKSDFPQKWPELLSKIVSALNSDCYSAVKSALKLSSSLFYKYRYEFESQQLWIEIKYVVENFAQPLTLLFKKLMNDVKHVENSSKLGETFTLLKYCVKIFHSLNSQDFVEYFEDHVSDWFPSFVEILNLSHNFPRHLHSEASKLTSLQIHIIILATMFAHKYSQDFTNYLNTFADAIWKLSLGSETSLPITDRIASECITFLRTAFLMPSFVEIFKDQSSLLKVCSHIVLPNITIQVCDEERFEDDPDEYTRLEIEGDTDSRRHSAGDFISCLSSAYETAVTPVFNDFIKNLLQTYNQNPIKNWKSKDAAIRILISMTTKLGSLKTGNSSNISNIININSVLTEIILPELTSDVNSLAMLKVCCLKYIIFFRKQLDPNLLTSLIPTLVNCLTSSNLVIQQFCCILLEEIFLLPDDINVNSRLNAIILHLQSIYSNITNILHPNQKSSSEYPLRALISILLHTHVHSKTYLLKILQSLCPVLSNTHNISVKPTYFHYLFESICVSIRLIAIHDNENLPFVFDGVIPIMSNVIEKDTHGCLNYAIQIMATLFKLYTHTNSNTPLSSSLLAFYSQTLQDGFWQGDADLVYSVILLVNSFLKTMPEHVMNSKGVIFYVQMLVKLLFLPEYDGVIFDLLNGILIYLSWSSTIPFPISVFNSIFQRLTKLKKPKFISGFCEFIYHFINKFSPAELYNIVNNIQPKLIYLIIENLMLPELEKPSQNNHKKCVAIAICQLLFSIPELMTNDLVRWIKFVDKLISSNPPSIPSFPSTYIEFYVMLNCNDIHLIPKHDHYSHDGGINVLKYAKHLYPDSHPITDVKKYIMDKLLQLRTCHGSNLSSLLNDHLSYESKIALNAI